jgi:hypothetical protein
MGEYLNKNFKENIEVYLSLCLINYHPVKTYEGVEVEFHPFLTSAIDGSEWLASHSGRLSPVKEPRCPLDSRLGGLQKWS